MGVAVRERVPCNRSHLQLAPERSIAVYHDDVVGLARGNFNLGLGTRKKLQGAHSQPANGIPRSKRSRYLDR